MAYASVRMTETSPLPRQSSQAPVVSMASLCRWRYQGSINLWPPDPEGERLSFVGRTWRTDLTLSKQSRAINSLLSCLSMVWAGPWLQARQCFQVISVTTIQIELLLCPVIVLETLGSLLGAGVSVCHAKFFTKHFKCYAYSADLL